jgi:hypothetical protein
MEGFVVKQDTECKNYEKQFVVPCLEGDQCAFAGCEDVNCNMIVNDKGEGKKFRVCHGEPVTAPDGSCSWVKGTAKKGMSMHLISSYYYPGFYGRMCLI